MRDISRIEDSVSAFLSKWRSPNRPSPEMARDYLDICGSILMCDEDILLEVTSILRRNMESWVLEHSPVYLRSRPYYCKEDLQDKSLWYVHAASEDSMDTHTSGSTTGFHFMYRRMKSTFERVEWDNHYDMVLDEFGIGPSPHLLYFFPNHFKKSGEDPVFCEPSPQPYLNSHGRSRRAVVHYANFELYKSDPNTFFSGLFGYLSENPIDVFFSSGPQISSMCHHIRRLGRSAKVGALLSQTNERMLQEDAEFLFVRNNYFDSICDHMRCWDGGASFFTCRAGNYHIMDNLSWCEEMDGRLVSTDYFNFSSPFVRYWNGDVCSLGSKFERCECGRLFREFEFVDNRSFSLSGVCLGNLKAKMEGLGIEGIRQVRCYVDSLNVISLRPLSDSEKSTISALEPRFRLSFLVEGGD